MKKYLFLLMIMCIITFSYSQKKWSFGAELFPNYSKALFKEIPPYLTVEPSVFTNSEFAPSLSFRVTASNTINHKSNLVLGIGHQSAAQKIITTSYASTRPVETEEFISRYNSLQLLAGYNYFIGKNFYVHSGLNLIYTYSNSRGSIDKTYSFNLPYSNRIGNDFKRDSYNFSLELGIGYNLISNENFILYAQPIIEKMVLAVHKNLDISERPLMIGVVIGTKF